MSTAYDLIAFEDLIRSVGVVREGPDATLVDDLKTILEQRARMKAALLEVQTHLIECQSALARSVDLAQRAVGELREHLPEDELEPWEDNLKALTIYATPLQIVSSYIVMARALRIYADPTNWYEYGMDRVTPLCPDGGNLARRALQTTSLDPVRSLWQEVHYWIQGAEENWDRNPNRTADMTVRDLLPQMQEEILKFKMEDHNGSTAAVDIPGPAA